MPAGCLPIRNPCLPCLVLGNPAEIPEPQGAVTYLGKMLDLQHEMPDGSEIRHVWETRAAPHLFWSEKRKALYVFVGVKLPKETDASTRGHAAAVDAYRRWTGRAPRGGTRVVVPRATAAVAGEASYILYRSNKWGPRWANYIHPFEGGVQAVLGPGKPPGVFMISGGALRLTKRGLEG